MRLLFWATSFVFLLLNTVEATSAIDDASHNLAICFTVRGTKSVASVPTLLNTVTIQATKTITAHVATSTKTVTTTKTVVFTASTHTDTTTDVYTVTSTAITYSTPPVSTKTVTKTAVVTVNSTSTTTSSPTSGFRPVKTTLTKSDKKKRDEYLNRLNARDSLLGFWKRSYSVPKYPQNVDCKVYTTSTSTLYQALSTTPVTTSSSTVTKTVTKTATSDETSTPIRTTTVRSTTHTTTTSIDVVPASVTTKTVTKTATTTDVIPGPTFYPACTGNNILVETDQNLAYFGVSGPYDYDVYTYNIATAYDCCVACLTQFNCTAGNWNSGYCSFGINKVCGPQQGTIQVAEYGAYDGGGLGNPIWNGYCGEIDSRAYTGD